MLRRHLPSTPGAADAWATGPNFGIGGWFINSNKQKETISPSDIFWFSHQGSISDLPDNQDWNQNLQKNIASLELLAQLALLWCRRDFIMNSPYQVNLIHDCDNIGSVATNNKLFSTKKPLCYVLQATVSWARSLRYSLDLNHLPGRDWLSRDRKPFIDQLDQGKRHEINLRTLLQF